MQILASLLLLFLPLWLHNEVDWTQLARFRNNYQTSLLSGCAIFPPGTRARENTKDERENEEKKKKKRKEKYNEVNNMIKQ